MKANAKQILFGKEAALATEAQIEAAEALVLKAATNFLAVGKRREAGWNQAINARFAYEWLQENMATLSKIEVATALHLLGNASAFRQVLEEKNLIARHASDWE